MTRRRMQAVSPAALRALDAFAAAHRAWLEVPELPHALRLAVPALQLVRTHDSIVLVAHTAGPATERPAVGTRRATSAGMSHDDTTSEVSHATGAGKAGPHAGAQQALELALERARRLYIKTATAVEREGLEVVEGRELAWNAASAPSRRPTVSRLEAARRKLHEAESRAAHIFDAVVRGELEA